MTSNGILQMALFFGVILLVTKPMGAYMARVFQGERTLLTPFCGRSSDSSIGSSASRRRRTCGGRRTLSRC